MNQHPFFWSSLQQGLPADFINVVPMVYSFSYESGLTHGFQISGTTGYTVTTGASWLSIDITGGTSGVTTLTIGTLLTNSGSSDWTQTVTVTSVGLVIPIVREITITQIFEPQPLLFIYTEGGSFVGELT